MNGLVFEYDPRRSKQNRQFTVRLSDRKKIGNRWEKQSAFKLYRASDLPAITNRISDKGLFRQMVEDEMKFRRIEGRFFSQDDEYTLLRISQNHLQHFVRQSQKKQILCSSDGSLLKFDFYHDAKLEFDVTDSQNGYRITAYLNKIELSKLDYLIRSETITGIIGDRILFVDPSIPFAVLRSVPLNQEISEERYQKIQPDISTYGNKIVLRTGGKVRKIERVKGIFRPIMNLDASFKHGELSFWYDNTVLVSHGESRTIIHDQLKGVEVHRDREKEETFIAFLKQIGVQYNPSAHGEWYLPPRELKTILSRLNEENVLLQVNQKPLRMDVHPLWKVEKRRGHLYVSGRLVWGKEKISSENLIDAFYENKRYADFKDGSAGFLPADLMSELRGFARNGQQGKDGIIFRDVDFPIVAEWLKDKSQVETDPEFRQLDIVEREDFHLKDVAVPKSLDGILRPYQIHGFYWLCWLYRSGFSGILADDMGLGKTLQVLAFLIYLKESDPSGMSLLIVPKTLIHNWVMEMKRFSLPLTYMCHTGNDRAKHSDQLKDVDLVITSYGLALSDQDIFSPIPWRTLILDEAQVIKNPHAKTTQAIKTLSSGFRISISGTPVENSPVDLWSHFDFLMPGMLGDLQPFRTRYRLDSRKRMRELNVRTAPYILRRMKQQVCHELPEKTEITLFCEFTETQRMKYNDVLAASRNSISDIKERENTVSVHILTALLRLRQIACDPALIDHLHTHDERSGKQEMILETAQSILSGGHKILIFSQFVDHLKLIRNQFDEEKIRSFYLDGSTRDRKQEIKRFQQCRNPCVFLISIKTGGLGLNLTQANYAFLLDPWWNPAVENQAIDRCYRIGQENPVTVYRFITKDSIEEKVMALKEIKRDMQEEIIGESDMDHVPLTEEELTQLLFD